MPDTFDPAKKSAAAVLSNGNLTITTAPAVYASALTQTGRTGAKGYAELTVNALGGSGALSIGIGNVSANLASIAGADANSVGYSLFDGSFRYSGSQIPVSLGTISAGSRLDVAVDFYLPDVWIRGPSGLWNGNASANPATGVNGLRALYYSTITALFASGLYLMGSVFSNSQGTLNTGDTAFAGTAPSGFTAWNATVPSTLINTTWNPLDRTAGALLSGSNLIATNSNNAVLGVRGINPHTNGRYYWECACNTFTGTRNGAGIVTQTYPLGSIGDTLSSIPGNCVAGHTGSVIVDGGTTLTVGGVGGSSVNFGTISSGAVICVAVDLTAKLAWFRLGAAGNWNNVAGRNPATGVGGVATPSLGASIPAYPAGAIANTNDQITANFGDTTFVGAVPSGFTAGWPVGGDVAAGASQARAMVLA